jgi:predicted MFS family arabinose efflux permease
VPGARSWCPNDLRETRCRAGFVNGGRRLDKDVGNPGQATKGSSGGLRLLQLAAFFSSFDRFAVAPMLLTIAASLGTSLAGVAATASLYYLLYGGMQPVWGMLSDRLGRVRVMRLTLFGAVFAGMISALAPNLAVLAAARALAGRLFAAVIPAALVYVGDTVGMSARQKALADLMASGFHGGLPALGGSLPDAGRDHPNDLA